VNDIQDRWKNLDVWNLADALARQVYQATKHFPRDELYGITSQLRRAALSVPTNIVEGYSRNGDRELARFLDIALGSLAEVKYLLHFSKGLGYISDSEYSVLSTASSEVGAKLWQFYTKVKQK
jgi:four helix bundle protein